MERGLYKKILIATDGSENGTWAINAGMEIARLSGGKAYALHVIDPAAILQEGEIRN